MAWAFLIISIVFEVGATLSLRAAVTGTWKWYIPVGVGYVVAFTSLSFALANGMNLGVAYGVWAASGVALTAVLSKFLFKEPLTLIMGAGVALIVGGVLLVELGSIH